MKKYPTPSKKLQLAIDNNERIYTVMHVRDIKELEGRTLCDLQPMSHSEASTFKSKMMKPADHMLIQIPNDELGRYVYALNEFRARNNLIDFKLN